MRPGCDRPADARLSYDTISCQVWLDQMPERLGPVQEICQFHAARLTVPRGWTLNDRRVDVETDHEFDRGSPVVEALVPEPVVLEPVVLEPVVLEPVARVIATATPRRSNRRRHPSSSARQLFEDDLVPAAPPAGRAEPDPDEDLDADLDLDPVLDPQLEANEVPGHAEVMAAISADVDDDLPESLRATSPLLARAFRATGPQRSVLSDELAQPARHSDD